MERQEILLVDDNTDLAENIGEILSEVGFKVSIYHHPQRALEDFTPGRYIVALLDIRMPEMNGVELYQRLKERDPALSAIALTAYADDSLVKAAVEEGILVVLPKPLDVPRLLTKISSVCSGEVILIVEDNALLAQNLAEILLLRGFSPKIVTNCQDARVFARSTPPSVAIVDWKLPDGDGLDLIEELCRPGPQKRDCLAVLFSGYPQHVISQGQDLSSKNILFFEKPLPLERLLAVLSARNEKPT